MTLETMDGSRATKPNWGWVAVALGSLGIGLASLRYLIPQAPGLAEPIVANAFTRYGALTVHAGFASVALLIGPFQFLGRWRARHLRLHRWLGRIYVASCLVAGAAGLLLAFGSTTGPVSTAGFGTLAALWIFTTFQAYTSARDGRIADHRRWMIRSFALTFAAVTLRVYLPFAFFSPFGYDNTYRAISFLCWVPNAVLTEMWVLRRRR